MTFYDASANAGQKIIAPPKGHFVEKIIDSKNILQKWLSQKYPASKNEKISNHPKDSLPLKALSRVNWLENARVICTDHRCTQAACKIEHTVHNSAWHENLGPAQTLFIMHVQNWGFACTKIQPQWQAEKYSRRKNDSSTRLWKSNSLCATGSSDQRKAWTQMGGWHHKSEHSSRPNWLFFDLSSWDCVSFYGGADCNHEGSRKICFRGK